MKKNIIEYLIDTVKKYPDKVAIRDKEGEITFNELNVMALRIAKEIRNKFGNTKNQPIAVYIEKSKECIAAFLGILYSGNFYSPIDIHMPKERRDKIMAALKPIGVIYKDKSTTIQGVEVEIVIDELSNIKIEKNDCYREDILDVDPVYVLFTSGSTGQPKGVVINHGAVIDYIEWVSNTFNIDESIVFGNQAPFYFDNSILDIYCMLKNGSTMIIIPENLFSFPIKLLQYINQNGINTLFWVPSALIGVANSNALEKIRLSNLRNVLFCGEVMPNKQLNVWRNHYPDILYANLYGPTEITDVCAYYIVNREFKDDEPLPIGNACENTEILILNDENKLVSDGEIGELHVRGRCLAMGYYGEKEKTVDAFIQNPLNTMYTDLLYKTGDLVKYNEYGEIIYLGRKDFQIKHQGNRIELGEIETIANSFEMVKQSCALYNHEKRQIYLVCATKEKEIESKIYVQLKQYLPKYMLPNRICLVDEMPLNNNGKIDRIKLKQLLV